MVVQAHQPGESALIKAVRNLDQGGSEAIPDKLDQIWKVLSIYTGGMFHAAEEMLVRWLLKNMNGSSDNAQKLRRFPLTWRILGKVFSSIPLFSLAKSLADRRFAYVLQTALKDASEPKEDAEQKQSSDPEMVDADSEQARPRKKQRSETVQFDLKTQSSMDGCLRTAESLFEALRLLLAQVKSDSSSNAKRDNHMGAEHVKSLFRSSAAEIKDLIVPALKICQLATRACDTFQKSDGQESWVATIRSIWDLHLQGDGDALQVATHLTPFAIDMYCRLDSTPDPQLPEAPNKDFPSMAQEVAQQWRQDLKRFLARGLILPARAAFLNKGDLEIMRLTIQSTSGFSTISCPVILDLTLSSPSLAGSKTAKRDNDSWIQAVFSLLDETLQSSRSKHRFAAVKDMLNQITRHKIPLSTQSLRLVCTRHGLQPDRAIWGIISTLAELNPDVFIIKEGDDLLQAVLDRLAGDDNVPAKTETIQRIAAGFARARDLSGFVKIWFRYLAAAEPHARDSEAKSQYRIWYNKGLRETIAHWLEKTMSAKQILSLVDWVESQDATPAENAAVILLLEALSEGIAQDDVADSLGMRIFEITFGRSLPSPVSDAVPACKWAVARRSLQWATLEQGYQIWTTSVTQLRDILAEAPLTDASAFEAFKFAAAAWVANRPGGRYEDAASELTLGALSRLDGTASQPADGSAEQRFIDYLVDSNGCSRLLSMVVERGSEYVPKLLKSALDKHAGAGEDAEAQTSSRTADRLRTILSNDVNTNSRATMDTVLKLVCAGLIKIRKLGNDFGLFVEALLGVPDDAVSRDHREELMPVLISAIRGSEQDQDGALESIKPVVSLMVKLMRRPTFYPNMAFSDIELIATATARYLKYSSCSFLQFLPLVEELATLTLKQMTANVGPREEKYFRSAVAAMKEPAEASKSRPGDLTVFTVVLMKRLILAIGESAALRGLHGMDISELEFRLTEGIKSVVEDFCSKWAERSSWKDHVESVTIVLGAADELGRHTITEKLTERLKKALSPCIPQLSEASLKMDEEHDVDVWALRKYLVSSFSEDGDTFAKLDQTTRAAVQAGSAPYRTLYSQLSENGSREGILDYVDGLTANMDDDTRLKHVETLLLQRPGASSQLVQLLAVQRIIQQLGVKPVSSASRTPGAAQGTFDLATAHTVLCKRLRSTESQAEFLLITRILESILEEKSHAMTQWNIELTLSTVCVLSSAVTTHGVLSNTPKGYACLCRLVQVIVRRHRLRLEGHFHLLVTVLQSLLRALICHPYSYDGGNQVWQGGLIKDDLSSFKYWAKHAKAFTRLLTMVCEPTPGSVARSQQSSLDSATDAAKRYAGQHMYLVLMLYIKLQLEQNVPHDVREALEPGVFAILDITSPAGRRIMNDALDASGRAIMRELYKQYVKFGKWSGI